MKVDIEVGRGRYLPAHRILVQRSVCHRSAKQECLAEPLAFSVPHRQRLLVTLRQRLNQLFDRSNSKPMRHCHCESVRGAHVCADAVSEP